MKKAAICFILLLLCSFAVALHMRSSILKMEAASPSRYLGKSPVFVAGGGRGAGYEFVKQLSRVGTPVHALVRSTESYAPLASLPGVKVTMGDALDEVAVRKAMEGCVAAVTMLGGRSGDRRSDAEGNCNVIEQAGILGVERVILTTSVGCGDSKVAVSKDIYKLFEETLSAKEKAENMLKLYTNSDWTIVRPAGLRSDAPTHRAFLTDDVRGNGFINRADLALLLVKVLGSNGSCTRRELTALDPSLRSYDEVTDVKPFPV